MWSDFLEADGQFLLWLQDHVRNPVCNAFFSIYTRLGDHGLIWIALGLILLVNKKTRTGGWLVLFSLLGSFLINNMILKNLVGRVRPYDMIENLTLLVPKEHDASFPSGHTGCAFSAAIAAAIALWRGQGMPKARVWSVVLIVSAVLVGFSRLYVGVHYPTDVIAGAVTGTLIAIAVYLIYIKLILRRKKNAADSDH